MGLSKRVHAARQSGRIAFGSASNADPIVGAIDARTGAEKLRDGNAQVRRSPKVAAVVSSLFTDPEPRR